MWCLRIIDSHQIRVILVGWVDTNGCDSGVPRGFSGGDVSASELFLLSPFPLTVTECSNSALVSQAGSGISSYSRVDIYTKRHKTGVQDDLRHSNAPGWWSFTPTVFSSELAWFRRIISFNSLNYFTILFINVVFI